MRTVTLSVVIATLIGAAFAEADVCGPTGNWLQFEGNCYTLLTARYTWNEFWARCQEYGAVGAKIFNNVENQFVWRMCDDGDGSVNINCWLGGNRIGRPHPEFGWQDGPGMNYTNWAEGQPDNGGFLGPTQECMIIREVDGTWDDIECDIREMGICKKAANVPLEE